MKISFSCVTLLVGGIAMTHGSHAQPAHVPQSVPQLQEHLRLRLPYTNWGKRAWKEKRIGFIENKDAPTGNINEPDLSLPDLFRGTLLATDSRGWLYFYDPVSRIQTIRAFNQQGEEVRRWVLPRGIEARRASVTPSGVVWVITNESGVTMTGKYPGLPVIALAPDKKNPVINWLGGMPQSVYKSLVSGLKREPAKQDWPEVFGAGESLVYTGGEKVRLLFIGFGNSNNYRRTHASITFNTIRHNVKTFVFYSTWNNPVSFLSSSGKEYYVDSDSTPKRFTWGNKSLSK